MRSLLFSTSTFLIGCLGRQPDIPRLQDRTSTVLQSKIPAVFKLRPQGVCQINPGMARRGVARVARHALMGKKASARMSLRQDVNQLQRNQLTVLVIKRVIGAGAPGRFDFGGY